MLDDRKLKILYAIIDSYINTSEPIGSRTISKQYDMGISSATVRNEMSDLEELGFLNKAYSSSGRIPSEKAYRHYVNYLLASDFNAISNGVSNFDALDKYINEKNKIFKESAKIISNLTDCIIATMITESVDTKLKGLDLVNIGNSQYVLVIVLDSGRVINSVFSSKFEIDEDYVNELIFYLKKYLIGVNISDVSSKLDELKNTFINTMPFFSSISNAIKEEIASFENSEIKLEGISNIFNFPEYQDIHKAKEFIKFLDNKEELQEIFLDCDEEKLCVRIGSENHKDFLKGNTIVASSFDLGKGMNGKIAVIGPTRMDYEKIIKTMLSLSNSIDNIFK